MVTTKSTKKGAEFNELRSRMYEEALEEYPLARTMDIEAMQKHLSPQKGDSILGIGEGNGYFCQPILDAIGYTGRYTITDPAECQLRNLKHRVNTSQLEIVATGAESIPITAEKYDKVWSFGAFHHCPNQTEAMKRIYKNLKAGGKLVICDVFQGSKLAQHFDVQAARYSNTGHEVRFLSDDFARSLCYLAGFKEDKIQIKKLPQKWVFDSETDAAKFIYKLHAMTFLPGSEDARIRATLKGCRDILGIKMNESGRYELNWPMKVLKATK